MVIHDIDVFRAVYRPSEDDPPLIVHADAVQARQVTPLRLEPIGGGRTQVTEHVSIVQHVELPHDDAGDPTPAFTARAPSIEEEVGRFPPAEGPDRHGFVYPIEV